MPRKQVFTGLYACPICENEFELYRAYDSELLCPSCREHLEPVLNSEFQIGQESPDESDVE
jgi:transcription initiation factor IIE alpha subunit